MPNHSRKFFRLIVFSPLLALMSASLQAQTQNAAYWGQSDHGTTIIPLSLMSTLPGGTVPCLVDSDATTAVTAEVVGAGDPALQTVSIGAPNISPGANKDGLGMGSPSTFKPACAPPDTNGAVGDTQYVQSVNQAFAVFSKSGNLLTGPYAGNVLFQALPSGHPCALNNDGDAIVQFDKAAHRWILSQLSLPHSNTIGYWECIAVSKTADALGYYDVYAFNYGTAQFNDYPKLAVWNNGYYPALFMKSPQIVFEDGNGGGMMSEKQKMRFESKAGSHGKGARRAIGL